MVLGRGVVAGGCKTDEVTVFRPVVSGAGVGVASALTLPVMVALVVLAFVGLLCGAGLADGFAGDSLVVAAGTCNDIVGPF